MQATRKNAPFLKAYGLGLAALAALGLTAGTAHADTTVFSSFGSNSSFEAGTGLTETGPNAAASPGISQGAEFTPSATGTLSSVTVAYFYGSGTDSAQLYLTNSFADLGDPAASLDSFDFSPQTSGPGAVYTIVSTDHPVLTAGQTYYLYGLDSGDENNAFNISPSATGTVISNGAAAGAYEASPNAKLPAFSVQEGTAATPEPSALAPFAFVGLGLLVLATRRRMSRAA